VVLPQASLLFPRHSRALALSARHACARL